MTQHVPSQSFDDRVEVHSLQLLVLFGLKFISYFTLHCLMQCTTFVRDFVNKFVSPNTHSYSPYVLHFLYVIECILFQVVWMQRPPNVLKGELCCNNLSLNL